MADLAKLRAELGDLTVIDDPARVLQKSRDFYWYSPVLKRQLDAVRADLVVEAQSEADAIRTLAGCCRCRSRSAAAAAATMARRCGSPAASCSTSGGSSGSGRSALAGCAPRPGPASRGSIRPARSTRARSLYFRPLQSRIASGQNLVLLMLSELSLDGFRDVLQAWPGQVLLERAAADPRRRALPVYELSWNHTTLHALKIDPAVTYLQVLYPPPTHVERALAMHRQFGEEVMIHLEFARFNGEIACFGLPIVRFTTENRLDEIIRHHEDHGCPIFNPHAFTLKEGGMKQVDHAQLALKREADPLGLLNPGKMLAWDHPDAVGRDRRSYLYQSLGAAR